MASRFGIGVLIAITTSCSAMAQSGPPVLALPPATMVPAKQGGSLPPGYGVSMPQISTTVRPAQPALVTTIPVQNQAPVQTTTVQTTTVQTAPVLQVPATGMQEAAAPQQQQTVQQNVGQQQGGQQNGEAAPPQYLKQTPEQRTNEHFMSALQDMMPLNPEQITKVKREADMRGSASARPSTAPTPVIRSINLSLRPGEMPPVLKTFVGNATTLTFADRTGAPWPVLSVTTGNPAAFKVDQGGPQGTSSSITVTPLQQFAYSNNLVVTLINNPIPVIFSIGAGGNQVDYRVDVSLRNRGPNATVDTPTASMSLEPTNDTVMQAFVDGVPPTGARRLHSERSDVEAWRIDDMMYIRTNLDLLSPAPNGLATHMSGIKVYSLISAPILILTQNGQTVKDRIEDQGGRK